MNNTNSHFTELMITKDASNNADFIFGIDMNKLFTDNSAYSALMEGMTATAKGQIAANSKILAFNITRRQVKRDLSLGRLESPLIPCVFGDETEPYLVVGTINNMRDVPISVSGQPSGMRYLTSSDNDLSNQTAGTYQYELYISFVDGFSPTMDALLKRLYAASDSISKYLAMLDIPSNYNSQTDRVAMAMNSSDIQKISKAYVDALSYFNKLKNTSKAQRRASSLIAFPNASKESIGTFQKRLDTIINKVQEIAFQTGTSVSPSSVANSPANSSATTPPIIEINHSFNNVVSVECRDNKYIDYFKEVPTRNNVGVNTYLYRKVKNSTPKTTYLEPPTSSLEIFASRGVTLKKEPLTLDSAAATRDLGVDTESFGGNDAEKYIGKSASAVGGLLKSDLSPLDLSTETLETDVTDSEFAAMFARSSSNDAETGRTMVLAGIELGDGDTPMPMSLRWEPLSTPPNAPVLCKQEVGSAEVINRFFITRAQ